MKAIQQTLIEHHTSMGCADSEQLDAVFKSNPFLLIEAPAGYGKTRTMVSKIAYLIATKQIRHPKRILALLSVSMQHLRSEKILLNNCQSF